MRENELIRIVSAAAKAGDWRAASWLLERRYPQRWARRRPSSDEVEQAGPDWLDELSDKRAVRRGEG
jgi:hypothetical protein